jgi:hypothetical protein
LDALSKRERRELLFELYDAADGLELDVGTVSAAGGDGGAVSMRHVHLPKLHQYGFVDWDRERDVVGRGPAFDEIEPLLDVLTANRDSLAMEQA